MTSHQEGVSKFENKIHQGEEADEHSSQSKTERQDSEN
jgi:hypothetical protein